MKYHDLHYTLHVCIRVTVKFPPNALVIAFPICNFKCLILSSQDITKTIFKGKNKVINEHYLVYYIFDCVHILIPSFPENVKFLKTFK